jgi:uncharacterized lipoprotein YmbA
MKNKHALKGFILIVLIIGLAACSKTPASRFYTLSPLADVKQNTAGDSKSIIGIAKVEVSPYLDRSEIITRSSATQIQLAQYDRWAEPLEDIVAMTVSENISRLQPSIQTITRPWPEAEVDYMLAIKIKRFDSDSAGNVRLDASWGIIDQKQRSMIAVHESSFRLAGSSTDYDSITTQMSRALLELSKEIATELTKVKK